MFVGPPGSTPLDPDSIAELIPNLTSQNELNEFEQANIARAEIWAYRSRALKSELLKLSSLQKLHEQMFYLTWRWAGKFRRSDTNIGIPWAGISGALRLLCDNTKYQIENRVYDFDEITVRFHHRLVSIHPFPNGNGRHARLSCDLLREFNGHPPFSWGSRSLTAASEIRGKYIAALKNADRGDVLELLNFVRS